MCAVVVVVVVVVEIITLYLVQNGAHLATTGYVASSPNHVQHNVHNHRLAQCSEIHEASKDRPWPKTPGPSQHK